MVFTPGYPAINHGAVSARGAAWETRGPHHAPCERPLHYAGHGPVAFWACSPRAPGPGARLLPLVLGSSVDAALIWTFLRAPQS